MTRVHALCPLAGRHMHVCIVVCVRSCPVYCAAHVFSTRVRNVHLQEALVATEQKLDIAKKRLYFPAAKGYGRESTDSTDPPVHLACTFSSWGYNWQRLPRDPRGWSSDTRISNAGQQG